MPSAGRRVSIVHALPKIGALHNFVAIGIAFHQRVGGGVPGRAMADRAVAVHVVVLDDRLIEQIVAEALAVSGVAVLLGPIAGVLGVVGGLAVGKALLRRLALRANPIGFPLSPVPPLLVRLLLLRQLLLHLLVHHLLVYLGAHEHRHHRVLLPLELGVGHNLEVACD